MNQQSERRVPRPGFDWADYEPLTLEPRSEPLETVEIGPDSGRHMRVAKGDILRLGCPDGAQVADVCFFNAADPGEHFWANQTLLREGAHVTRGARLWGTMPHYRPLATVIADTVSERVDLSETRHHILLGAHCNSYMWLLATGRDDHPNCYDQLCDAVDAAGIPRELIHDNVNFFQRTRLDVRSDQYVTEASAVRPGDYVELYAEMDLVVAISACPMGSGRHRAESGERDTERLLATTYRSTHRPPPFSYPPPSSELDATGPAPDSESSERYHHRRPIEAPFYAGLRARIETGGERRTSQLGPAGTIIRADAGDLVSLALEGDAQVVLMYAWNRHEPRERIWTNETSSVENCFMVVNSRLWSTMPWFRALLTVVEDTLDTIDAPGQPVGRHHFVLDGWETPAIWAADGGATSVPSAWDRFERLLSEAGFDPRLHRDHVALFRKVAVDPSTQRLSMLPSDAVSGDRVTLYAEMDVDVALVPSPYRGGGSPASQMDGRVAPVRLETWPSGMEPLGWPYPGVPYPDIEPYIEALGTAAE